MGLTGFAIAVQRAEEVLGLTAGAGQVLVWFAAALFLLRLFRIGAAMVKGNFVLKTRSAPAS